MKVVFSFLFFLTLSFQIFAQEQNHLFTNVSFGFFGTGDLKGTAIGMDYHRTLLVRFGVHLGYSKTTGSGEGTLGNINNENRQFIDNLLFDGSSEFAGDIANYDTYLIGINYKVADGSKHILLASAGLNYKNIKYNYLSGFRVEENLDGSIEAISIIGNNLVAETEVGFYGGLDYLYVFDNSISLGIHLAVENSSNILSKAGLSIGFRF